MIANVSGNMFCEQTSRKSSTQNPEELGFPSRISLTA